MKLAEYDYNLPKELIAQYPAQERDSCRLMAVNRKSGIILHRRFHQLGEFIHRGDCLVLNNTKVVPARLFGKNLRNGIKVEVFFLRKLDNRVFEAMTKPGRKIKDGDKIVFMKGKGSAKVIENGRTVKKMYLEYEGDIFDFLKMTGSLPLPPYIKRESLTEDYKTYQTVYAEKEGAVAAPTAGLHFTTELLGKLKDDGVKLVFTTLHVGYGSFQSLNSEDANFNLYPEYFEIDTESSNMINLIRKAGNKIWAVGTSVCRALETSAGEVEGGYEVRPQKGWTNLFIQPLYQFKMVDGFITNFHLPRTSLLLLVSAFCGKELLMQAYEEAITRRYRFYSYGDAMLIT